MAPEEALEYVAPDELIEVTPKNIRLGKAILDTDRARGGGQGVARGRGWAFGAS